MRRCRVIGITGAGRGTGTTHLCIWMANYLSGCLMRPTALLQWNSHGDFEILERVLKGQIREESSCYRFFDVAYYKQGDSDTLAACMDGAYEEILIDFGELREDIRGEWLRCGVRIITGSLSEWKLEAFLGFLVRGDGLGQGWTGAVFAGSEDTRRAIERQFGVRLVRIPLSVDAFSVDRRAMDWFEGMLK